MKTPLSRGGFSADLEQIRQCMGAATICSHAASVLRACGVGPHHNKLSVFGEKSPTLLMQSLRDRFPNDRWKICR